MLERPSLRPGGSSPAKDGEDEAYLLHVIQLVAIALLLTALWADNPDEIQDYRVVLQVPGPPEHKDRGDKAEEAAQEVAGDDGWLPSSKQECLSCQESEELRAQCDRLDQVRPQQDHQEPQQLLASQQEPPGVGGRDFSSQQYDLNRDSQEDEDASSCIFYVLSTRTYLNIQQLSFNFWHL